MPMDPATILQWLGTAWEMVRLPWSAQRERRALLTEITGPGMPPEVRSAVAGWWEQPATQAQLASGTAADLRAAELALEERLASCVGDPPSAGPMVTAARDILLSRQSPTPRIAEVQADVRELLARTEASSPGDLLEDARRIFKAADRLAERGVPDSLRGGVVGRGVDRALANAVWVVGRSLVKSSESDPMTEDRIEPITNALVAQLAAVDPNPHTAEVDGPLREHLHRMIAMALVPLESSSPESRGLGDLDVHITASELADRLLERLTDTLPLLAGSEVGDLARQLQIDRQANQIRRLEESVIEEDHSDDGWAQARQICGWVTVETTPPQIELDNNSPTPIFHVRPQAWLLSENLSGDIVAQVGPLAPTEAAQVSPGHGCVWALPVVASWGSKSLVSSQLHIYWRDAAGRRWARAHDTIWRVGQEPR